MYKEYKRVDAKNIRVGDLCLGIDRSTIYKIKSTSVRQDSKVELYSSPINSTNPFETYINIFDPHEIVHVVKEEPMTTSVEDIQKEITKAQQTLKELQEKLEAQKTPKWEPKGGRWCVNPVDTKVNGLEFETEEAVEKAAIAYRRYHRLYKLTEELNEGWEPNWNDHDESKYYIVGTKGKMDYVHMVATPHTCGIPFKSADVVKKAITIIETGGLDD